MPQHVLVVPYNPAWAGAYRTEARRLARILEAQLISIHHIGSTAVPGLAAKPILDLLPVVRNIEQVNSLIPAFEAIGYESLGEFGIPGRRYFRKGGDRRTHQVHVFQESQRQDILRHLALRDYLRTHPEAAAAYGALKQELAERCPYDIEGYCNGKDTFVKELERKALEWVRSSPEWRSIC